MKYKHPTYTKYSCDLTGTVYGARGNPLKPMHHHTGYPVMTVRNSGKDQRQLRCHRFIVECVLGRELTPTEMVNHLDGNKHNNDYTNLEVTTAAGNTQHAYDTGLMTGRRGETHPNSKLTEDAVRHILASTEPHRILAELYGVRPNYISLVKSGRRWGYLKDESEGSTTIPSGSTGQVSGKRCEV